MIRADINELFPITVSLVDEIDGVIATGRDVYYDVRKQPGGMPALSGTLIESSTEPGIYESLVSLNIPGNYIVYATCSGFLPNSEDIIVNPENIYELTKQNRNYNTSVEDVVRTNPISTASQTARKVALGNTDYILTKVKFDSDSDWTGTVASGFVYAHYRSLSDSVPYKMAGEV